MVKIDIEKAKESYKRLKEDSEWVKQNQPSQELIDKVNEGVRETLEWMERQEKKEEPMFGSVADIKRQMELFRKTCREHPMTTEEVDYLLNLVDNGDDDLTDKDAMLLIMDEIQHTIKSFVAKYKKYPSKFQLLEIYNLELTANYKFIKKFPSVYIFCNDMVNRLRGDIPYEIKVDDVNKTVTVCYVGYSY